MVKRQRNMEESSTKNTLSRRYHDTLTNDGEQIYTWKFKFVSGVVLITMTI
jgi:hypothetical protein